MTKEEFKKLCSGIFIEYGFKKYKSVIYYKMDNDVAIFLNIQKSNFGNSYYINVYYYRNHDSSDNLSIQQLYDRTSDEYLRFVVFGNDASGAANKNRLTSMIEYESYDAETIDFYLRQNFDIYVDPVFKNGFKYIETNKEILRSPKYRKFVLKTPSEAGKRHGGRKMLEMLVKIEVFICSKLKSRFGRYVIKLRFMEKTQKKRLEYMLLLLAVYATWRIVHSNDAVPLIGNGNAKMSLADPMAFLLIGILLLLLGKSVEKGKWRNVLFGLGVLCVITASVIMGLAVLV